MSAHDRHLADYHEDTVVAKCETCREERDVTLCFEYGQGWFEPEEHRCDDGRYGSWLRPGDPGWDEEDDDDDEE
jgi:hypothetical protein